MATLKFRSYSSIHLHCSLCLAGRNRNKKLQPPVTSALHHRRRCEAALTLTCSSLEAVPPNPVLCRRSKTSPLPFPIEKPQPITAKLTTQQSSAGIESMAVARSSAQSNGISIPAVAQNEETATHLCSKNEANSPENRIVPDVGIASHHCHSSVDIAPTSVPPIRSNICRRSSPETTAKNRSAEQGFSILKPHDQGDIGSIWSSMGFYVFSIHIPLSFGGLSTVAKILNQPVLDPHIEAFCLLGIQIVELSIVLLLLNCPGKPQYRLSDFFHATKRRSVLLASLLGFGFLISLVIITSYFADLLMEPKDVNDPFLKQILSSGPSSLTACTLAYCIITPLLEEVVYRGFLVKSLLSKMKWQQAVVISSVVFSLAHFSGENFLQLLVVGFILGCSYCWTGNLSSSIAIHSLYNALILFSTFTS